MKNLIAAPLLLLSAICHGAAPALLAPDDLRADLRAARAFIERTHPAPPPGLDEASARIGDTLSRPLTRDQAWQALARLNPLFADAHVHIGFEDWHGEARAHLQAGGGFFPFEVAIGEDGRPRILSRLGGEKSSLAGLAIERINGRDARALAAELMERMHGDTPQFRRRLLAQRFWVVLWKTLGAPSNYGIKLESGAVMQVRQASHEAVALKDAGSFERQFQFQLLPGKAALLVLGSFDWPDKERYLAFTRDAFTRIEAEGVNTLLVDVRLNGGGSDDYWMDGVLRHVATKRYRWASGYVKRVLEGRAEPGQRTGDLVTGEVTGWIEPDPTEALHFGGRLYVLTGDATYSSAILFANTVQDFGFGIVAGPGAAVHARQSGGTQRLVLPKSGLVVSSPRFVLDRPSGLRVPALFTPDLVMQDDEANPAAIIDAVLAHSRAGSQ